METPSPDYIAGYRQANSDAGCCGAHNPDSPPDRFALCTRRVRHTGMHDDTWLLWGDRDASEDENARDVKATRAKFASR